MRKAVRPYVAAVRRDLKGKDPALEIQHQARVRIAEEHLASDPFGEYGWKQLVEDARRRAEKFLPQGSYPWLPDVAAYLTDYVE